MSENKTPEFEPPQACVQRVIKAVLPDNVQIGKEAKGAFSRSAGIFIMYLTACANDFCREAKRQTISAQDVMQAIKELEFGELEEPLREYLDQFRREANAKKQSKALGNSGGVVAKKEETGDIDEHDGEQDGGDHEGETEGGMGGEGEADGDGDDTNHQADAPGMELERQEAQPQSQSSISVPMDEERKASTGSIDIAPAQAAVEPGEKAHTQSGGSYGGEGPVPQNTSEPAA